MSSSKPLAKQVPDDCNLPPGVKCWSRRGLGGDATDGSRRRAPTHQGRFLGAQRKVSKVLAPRGAGAPVGDVFRAGVSAKPWRGASVQGLPNGELKSPRASALRAEGRLPRGCSLELASMCSRG
eukprot:4772131-Pyramimonas_sp.AAC.1